MLRSKLKIKGDINEEFEKELNRLLKDLKDATPVDTGKARDAWRREGTKLVNSVEYMEELNGGSSKQAPRHFIEQTVLRRGFKPKGNIVKSR